MHTPNLASLSSFSSIIALLGVSLTTRTSLLPSFMQTDTARDMSVSAMPHANLATEDSEQGATIMASYLKLPEEMQAKRSESSITWSAMAQTSS